MPQSIRFFFFLVFPLALLAGCGGGGSPTDSDENGTSQNISSIKVMLPEGSTIDLAGTRVLSGDKTVDVQPSGDSKALHREGGRGLALLQSKNGTPLLMGFIDDNNKEISLRSTLITALYYAMGTVFQPEAIRAHYFDMNKEELLSDEVVNEAKRLFLENDDYLRSPEFAALVQQMKDTLLERSNTVDVVFQSRPPGTLEVVQNSVKSGVQIEEVDHKSFRLTNQYRRRAHAFIYRVGYKVKDAESEVVLISDITSRAPSPIKDVRLPPTKALREFTGVIQDAAAGEGMKMAITQSDVVDLDLADGNEYDLYKVRVVGPGLFDKKLPPLERQKEEELSWDTLVYDMALPLLLDAIGEAELAGGGPDLKGLDEKYFENFRRLAVLFASSVPSVEEALKSQDYSTALTELFYAIGNNASSALVMEVFDAFILGAEAYAQELGEDIAIKGAERTADLVANVATILRATDTLLKIGDYARIIYALSFSSQLEEWDVKAKGVPVTLLPKGAIAYPFILKPLKAYVKDTQLAEGEVFEFRWSTTGNYGVLKDDKGHEGIAFSSSSLDSPAEVYYFSNVDDADLPDDAEDQVKVEVYIQGPGAESKIAEDTVKVQIKRYDYIIRPDGITVDADTLVRLRLQYPDGEEDITDSNYFDYKVTWNTSGLYGAFPGPVTSRDVYNGNTIEYRAGDKEVSHGVETISAAIYYREKGDSSSPYRLIQEAEATIVIENDDKVDYDTQAMQYFSACTDAGPEIFRRVVYVPKKEEAVRYTVSTIGDVWAGWAGVWWPESLFPPITWTNTSWKDDEVTDLGNVFRVHIVKASAGACGGAGSAQLAARYQTIRGYALIATYY